MKQSRDDKSYYELCEKLRLEEHKKDSVVFHYGDPGSTFYVVLEGSVEVRVPVPIILERDSATPEGLISFIIMYFHFIHWKELHRGRQVLHLFYNELRRCNIMVDEHGDFNAE